MKSDRYAQVLRLLESATWAILPDHLDTIWAVVAARIYEGRLSDDEIRARTGGNRAPYEPYNLGNVRVIPIHGVISKRMPLFADVSGGTSTEFVQSAFQQALSDPDVAAILLDIDSPGGTTDGPFDLSEIIYSSRGNKPVRAFANGMMASAAYLIGSAADEVFATQTAIVGSIGVITAHYDISKYLENAGVKKTYLTAGKYKAVPNEAEPLNDESKKYVQERLDYLYTMFVDSVARNRGVDSKQVLERMADGRLFIGAQAIDNGLIDRVSTAAGAMPQIDQGGSFEEVASAYAFKHNVSFKQAVEELIREAHPAAVEYIENVS